jgi:hypothetical protein
MSKQSKKKPLPGGRKYLTTKSTKSTKGKERQHPIFVSFRVFRGYLPPGEENI